MLPTLLSPLRALSPRARAFVYRNADHIDEFLRPSLAGMREELRQLEGDSAAVLLENFRQSNYDWEMYFWGCLAHRWLRERLDFDRALAKTSEDLVALGELIETRVFDLFDVDDSEDPTEVAVA